MIIGITGKKRSGKDSVGDVLTSTYGFTRYGLADPMKEAVGEIFLMSDEQLWGEQKEIVDERYNTTPRKILQVFGTELFQYDVYKHIPEMEEAVPKRTLWINRFKLWYKQREMFPDFNVVLTDIRFPHEANVIKELGGFIIKIIREIEEEEVDEHPSEVEMDEIEPDYLLMNDETLDALNWKVIDLIEKLKLGEDNESKGNKQDEQNLK